MVGYKRLNYSKTFSAHLEIVLEKFWPFFEKFDFCCPISTYFLILLKHLDSFFGTKYGGYLMVLV